MCIRDSNYALQWVGMLPGVRESRRLVGDYLLNENDVLENRRFEDAVAYGGWPVDRHASNGIYDRDKEGSFIHNFPGFYTIPYRSYYSKNVKNLMVAGRAIGATKLGMASSRVMGTCAVGGQAAGTAAAMCIQYGCPVSYTHLRRRYAADRSGTVSDVSYEPPDCENSPSSVGE